MRPMSNMPKILAVTLFLLAGLATSRATAQPLPAPAPGGPANIFFGAVPPSPPNVAAPEVLVFIHGLGGTADNWWLANNTYQKAFAMGYRTAFIEVVPDGSIVTNGGMLKTALPIVAAHYGADKMVLVGHSKGAVDLQVAMMTPSILQKVKAVFTFDSPNAGSELADWAFGPGFPIAQQLGLVNPGVYSLQVSNMEPFRAVADPVLRASGIPFWTMEGTVFRGNPITDVTGLVLKALVPDEHNDGFVTVARQRLPDDYATDTGGQRVSHFKANDGEVVMPLVHAKLQGLSNTLTELQRIQANGFGDASNTWTWSMKWFQGRLYVGTGREITCATLLTSDMQQGTSTYPIAALGGGCPTDVATFARSLAAEIWRYDPGTKQWERVFKSPENILLMADPDGLPIFTARDIGFRGMTTFTEPGGTEALYVGGVTSGSMFDRLPQFATRGYPPPRILRSTDGENWSPIPQLPGTYLGDIGMPSDQPVRTIRGLTEYNGKLFATAGTFTGLGRVIASANPAAGNNQWFDASPGIADFPAWDLRPFAGRLYTTTGNKEDGVSDGYSVWWTDATGPAPYTWHPVVVNGGYQIDPTVRAPNGLSMAVFKDELYVGTNRPTELVRIRADGSWDLLVGEPRMTPWGRKTPLTGMGLGFGSWFNGHFWRMTAHEGHLYLGTWDWSLGARFLNLEDTFGTHFGFDLYRSADGIKWEAVTRAGFGDLYNYGGRSLESTPEGLFLGSTRPQGGLQIWHCEPPACTDAAPQSDPPPPQNLTADSEELTGRNVQLWWDPSPGAVQYRVYRATVRSVLDFLGVDTSTLPINIPGLPNPITFEAIESGALDFLCAADATDALCLIIQTIKGSAVQRPVVSVPTNFQQVAIVSSPTFSEVAPTDYQSLYFVRAENAQGELSTASNFVGAPSKAAAQPVDLTPPVIAPTVTPPPNADGWHNGPVTVSWFVDDPETNLLSASGCAPTALTSETAGVTLSCTATNGQGLTAEESVTVKIDLTPPTVVFGALVPPANGAGWNNTDVSIPFTAADALSGVASISTASPLVFTGEGANQVGGVTVTDVAGNSALFVSPAVGIDTTAPEAHQRFDPATLDLVFFGIDARSGVAAGPIPPSPAAFAAASSRRHDDDDDEGDDDERNRKTERRRYEVADLAGNVLAIVEDVRRAGHDVKGEILTLQYGNGPVVDAPDNQLKFEYAVRKKTGAFKELNQRMRIGKGDERQEIHAKYDGKKDRTKVEAKGSSEDESTQPMLHLLRVTTAGGQLTIGVENDPFDLTGVTPVDPCGERHDEDEDDDGDSGRDKKGDSAKSEPSRGSNGRAGKDNKKGSSWVPDVKGFCQGCKDAPKWTNALAKVFKAPSNAKTKAPAAKSKVPASSPWPVDFGANKKTKARR